jgi:hypothetical protein
MNESAELFSNPGNYAVVQLPGRKFSGVVFQGDSLHSLTQNIEELREMALKFHDNEVNIGFADICETLNEVQWCSYKNRLNHR